MTAETRSGINQPMALLVNSNTKRVRKGHMFLFWNRYSSGIACPRICVLWLFRVVRFNIASAECPVRHKNTPKTRGANVKAISIMQRAKSLEQNIDTNQLMNPIFKWGQKNFSPPPTNANPAHPTDHTQQHTRGVCRFHTKVKKNQVYNKQWRANPGPGPVVPLLFILDIHLISDLPCGLHSWVEKSGEQLSCQNKRLLWR